MSLIMGTYYSEKDDSNKRATVLNIKIKYT